MKTVLFYGDSNTWGFDPKTRERYPFEERWTTICAEKLGLGFQCVASGMNGRTTVFDDPLKACRNGVEGLDYALQTHKPIDIFVLMLGTNDLKYTDANGSAEGMERLLKNLTTANQRYPLSSPIFPEDVRILLVSPVLLHTNITEVGSHDAVKESEKIAGLYQALAEKYKTEFLDASAVTDPSTFDGVHLGRDGHRKLGLKIAEKLLSI